MVKKRGVYLPDAESEYIFTQLWSFGLREELLELIDYAKAHGGNVPIEYLHKEVRDLAKIDQQALTNRMKKYRKAKVEGYNKK